MNSKRTGVLCVAVLLALVGCEDTRSVGTLKTTGKTDFIVTQDTISAEADTVFTVHEQKLISLDIKYKLLVGMWNTEPVVGSLSALNGGVFDVNIESGAAYFIGDRPYGTASGGGGSSSGSGFIIQAGVEVDLDPKGARFIFIQGDSMEVSDKKGGTDPIVLEEPGYYVEVKSDGTLNGPLKVSDFPTIQTFVDDFLQRASDKGLDTP